MVNKIFYQSSLPRAGSTLLQNILGQNPEIYVTPTSGVLELIFSSRVQYSTSLEFKAQDSELMRKAYMNFCKEGMNGFYNAITDKPYIMDKSRGWGIHYNLLDAIHGKPKIICMVRDLRAIFASMEKKYRANPDKDDGVLNWSKMEGTTTEKRVNKWAQTPPIGIAIERLKQMMDEGISNNILFVRFEDLTRTPKTVMAKIYDYLELEHFEHDFDNIEQITQEDDSVYGIYGDHKIQKKLKYLTPDYNEVLGMNLSHAIAESFRWFYDYFEYEI